MSRPPPKAMLIDLDDTILSFGPREALTVEIAQEFDEAAHPLSHIEIAERIESALHDFFADRERHRIARARPLKDVRREIVADVFAPLEARAPGLTRDVAHAFADRFHEEREGRIACFPGAIETVDALKERGLKLALITNGRSVIQRGKIARFGLEHRFDRIQIEEEHGYGKPESRAYLDCMEGLGVGPDECWMIGDNLEWEVAAPQALGIYSIWVDGYGRGLPEGSKIVPDRIVRRLTELIE